MFLNGEGAAGLWFKIINTIKGYSVIFILFIQCILFSLIVRTKTKLFFYSFNSNKFQKKSVIIKVQLLTIILIQIILKVYITHIWAKLIHKKILDQDHTCIFLLIKYSLKLNLGYDSLSKPPAGAINSLSSKILNEGSSFSLVRYLLIQTFQISGRISGKIIFYIIQQKSLLTNRHKHYF